MDRLIRSITGAAWLIADGASQLFDGLAERGRAVRPGDGTLAGALDGALTVHLPSKAGHAVGATINAAIGILEQARGLLACGQERFEHAAAAFFRHAGLPTQEDFDEMRGRLDHVAAALEQYDVGARPAPPMEASPPSPEADVGGSD